MSEGYPLLDPADQSIARDWFGASDMANMILDHDWDGSAVGPMSTWPAALVQALGLILRSSFELAVYWGPDLVVFYNDAERAPLGELHPHALGQPARVVLTDLWDEVGPMLEAVLATGTSTWAEDQPLVFRRGPAYEEAYFTWSYSPILGDTGRAAGVLLVTKETTRHVLAERRLQVLSALAERTGGLLSVEDAWRRSVESLVADPDIVRAEVYVVDKDQPRLVAAASNGTEGRPSEPVDVGTVAKTGEAIVRPASGDGLHGNSVVLLPLSDGYPVTGVSVLALALRGVRLLDRGQQDYLQLAATQVARAASNAVASVDARERSGQLAAVEERRRIERDLHDTIQRQLLGARLVTELARELGMQDPAAVDRRLEEVSDQLGTALSELREVIEGSYPSQLRTRGLPQAISAAAERAHLALSIDPVPIGRLDEATERALYFATLEAVQNAIKHGGAGAAVQIRFRETRGVLSVHIHDSGTGFDEARVVAGDGIRNMHERLRAVGGSCHIRSRPGSGTWVRLVCSAGLRAAE